MFNAYAGAPSPDGKELTERAVEAATDAGMPSVHLRPADRAQSTRRFYDLCHGLQSQCHRTLERSGDTRRAVRWRWLEGADTTGCHVSLLLQILPFSFTDTTRYTQDQEYESNTGAAAAAPLDAALGQRGVKNFDTLNRLVTHATRLDRFVLAREETRDIMFTWVSLAAAPHPREIGALDKGKGKGKFDKGQEDGKHDKGTGQLGDEGEGKQGEASSRDREGTGSSDNELQCIYCGKKGHRERDCREQICEQKMGQEELDEPGCGDQNEGTRGWIHTPNIESSPADDRMLTDRSARSACLPRSCSRTNVKTADQEQHHLERRTEQRSRETAREQLVCAVKDTALT